MQLSFRLDKQPGESHLALNGKKLPALLQALLKPLKSSLLEAPSSHLQAPLKPFSSPLEALLKPP